MKGRGRVEDKYMKIESLLKEEQDRELGRLISALASSLSDDAKNREDKSEDDSFIKTRNHKKRIVFLEILKICCECTDKNYTFEDFHTAYGEKLKQVADDFSWLNYHFTYTDEVIENLSLIFYWLSEIPVHYIQNSLSYYSLSSSNKPSYSLFEMIEVGASLYLEYGFLTDAEVLLRNGANYSRSKNNLTKHREYIIHMLATWGDHFPSWSYTICTEEAHLFRTAEDEYGSDFLWFYGCALEQVGDIQRAKQVFSQCLELRKKIYGNDSWYTIVAERELSFWKWTTERNTRDFEVLLNFIQKVETANYTDVDTKLVRAIEGKTLYPVLIDHVMWDGQDSFSQFMSVYKDICLELDEEQIPLIGLRLYYNMEGSYFLKKGEYLLAEQSFMAALSSNKNSGANSILTDAALKSNLLMVYYVQNDLTAAGNMIVELMDIIENDSENEELSEKDIYRIYSIIVSVQMQAMIELDEEEKDELKSLLFTACDEIINGHNETEDSKREVAIFTLVSIIAQLQNENSRADEQKICLETLLWIEKNIGKYEFDNAQKALLNYAIALLAWNLNEGSASHYMEQSAEMSGSSYVPAATRAAVYQTNAFYYAKTGNHEKSMWFLKQAIDQMDRIWKNCVKYLNDERLIQILVPTQYLFAGCYAMMRQCSTVRESYECLIQFKALASHAGYERNRIIGEGAVDQELLEEIRDVQNKLAVLETNMAITANELEYTQATERLRELERQFAISFPKSHRFTRISWDSFEKSMPDNVVLVEYFLTCSDFAQRQFENTDKDIDVVDIYIVSKCSGVCKIDRVTSMQAELIIKTSGEFVSTLQAISSGLVTSEQLALLEEHRNFLYEKLVSPIFEFIGGQDTIYLAPDGELINLPFDILYGADQVRLADDYTVIKIECGRNFVYDTSSSEAIDGNLIIGNPAFDSFERSLEIESEFRCDLELENNRSVSWEEEKICDLPFAEIEARRITDRIGGECLTGIRATKKSLLDGRKYKNIHIATHGFFDGTYNENVLFSSCLLFAGVKNWIRTGEISIKYGNGIVTADEISRMDLRTVDLIVLSSCMSAMNDALINKGLHGMVGALSAAGVKYVISHLWDANDLSTAIMMDSFYFYYGIKHLSPPEAMARAQDYLRKITVGELKKKGWFAYFKNSLHNKEMIKRIEEFENCSERMRPFKNEIYWGGFVCYRCN